jgi:hypothetical protein
MITKFWPCAETGHGFFIWRGMGSFDLPVLSATNLLIESSQNEAKACSLTLLWGRGALKSMYD